MTDSTDFEVEVLSNERVPAQIFGTRDARHVFWFEPTSDGRQRLWADGRRLRPFDELMPVATPGPAVLSDVGGRFAYVCRRGGAFFVGADGAEYGPYAAVSTGIASGPPLRFSPDGRHLAFYATIGDCAHLVLDGVPRERVGPERSTPIATEVLAASGYGSHGVTFSPDASRMAYVAVAGDGRSAREWVVIDDVGGPAWDGVAQGPIIFSGDGRRFAYGARQDGRWRMVVDGHEQPTVDGLGGGLFSPDGTRFAYGVWDGDECHLVADGNAGPAFRSLADVEFSPDSRRLAYVAGQGKQFHVVVDGIAGPPWDQVWSGVSFSPDGRRLAYLAEKVGGGFLKRTRTSRAVVDSAEGRPFDEVGSPLVWSADGVHSAFTARNGDVWAMVVDDAPGPPCDRIIGPPYWSTTGRLAYIAVRQRVMSVIADGVAGPALGELSAEAGTGRTLWFSPDGLHIVHLGTIDGAWHAIVDDRVGPPMQGVDNPAFSPGSVTFIGLIDGKPVRLTARLGE